MSAHKVVATLLIGLFSVSFLTACNCIKAPPKVERIERAYPGGK